MNLLVLCTIANSLSVKTLLDSGHFLCLISFELSRVFWFIFFFFSAIAKPILNNVKEDLLKTHCIPIVTRLKERAQHVLQAEEDLKKEFPNGGTEMEEAEYIILEVKFEYTNFIIFTRIQNILFLLTPHLHPTPPLRGYFNNCK